MLQAGKADLVYSLHKANVDLQKLEIDFFVHSLTKLSTIAGILAGFGISCKVFHLYRKLFCVFSFCMKS